MNEIIQNSLARYAPQLRVGRLVFSVILIILLALPAHIGEAVFGAYADAYLGVAVFVYLTLFGLYALEKFFNTDMLQSVQGRPVAQIVLAAGLGMMPGCGGAILVVTGYASGSLSFGAMVATLTATMGDAAFLLVAEAPMKALIVLPVAFVTGIITGLITDLLYKDHKPNVSATCAVPLRIGEIRFRDKLVLALFLPGIIFGIAGLLQIELPAWVDTFAVFSMVVTLLVWAFSPLERQTHERDHPVTRANEETAFVLVWVLVAFLLFEISQAVFGFELAHAFDGFIWLTPLIAALIGFIPGCGPQIIVTTAYLTGAIPFGALISNAIANDGDALFPAIAIAPKDAMVASILTTLPALIVGYGFLLYIDV